MTKKMRCPKCDYGWETRVKKPKSCPRCKTRLDGRKRTSDKISKNGGNGTNTIHKE